MEEDNEGRKGENNDETNREEISYRINDI